MSKILSKQELFNLLDRSNVTPEEVYEWIRAKGGTTQKETKVSLIMESLKRIEKRLKDVNYFLETNYVSRIIELRQEAQKIMVKHGEDYKTISKLIEPLAKEEKEMRKISKMDFIKLMDEKVKLEFEQEGLRNELFRENMFSKGVESGM